VHYKGYSANITFDDKNDLLHGEIVGIRDVVTFQGWSVEELRAAFRDSMEDYLDFCRQRGESPDTPLSGRFVLRISPELHHRLQALACKSGQSLNAWIAARLEDETLHRAGASPSEVSGPGGASSAGKTTGHEKATRKLNPTGSTKSQTTRRK
jgi:predicted HicB family RNase H-like nuclease